MCSTMLLVVQSTMVSGRSVRGSAAKATTISLVFARSWAPAGSARGTATATPSSSESAASIRVNRVMRVSLSSRLSGRNGSCGGRARRASPRSRPPRGDRAPRARRRAARPRAASRSSAAATSARAMPRRRYDGSTAETVDVAAPAVPAADDRAHQQIVVDRHQHRGGGVLDHLVDLLGGVGGARARVGVVPEVQQRGALVGTAGSDDDRHQTRKRGSSTSRSQSPTRLMPSAVKASAAPGKAASHHAT